MHSLLWCFHAGMISLIYVRERDAVLCGGETILNRARNLTELYSCPSEVNINADYNFSTAFQPLQKMFRMLFILHRSVVLKQGSWNPLNVLFLCYNTVAFKMYSRIQELMADDQKEAGRIPRTIECELVQDLVDSCVPGDVITITGIVKVSNTEEGMLGISGCSFYCLMFIQVLILF